MNQRIIGGGAILVITGLSVLLFAGDRFATFDACVANPTYYAEASPDTLEGCLALIARVALAV